MDPIPKVELTKPLVPVAAPAEPGLVPPLPEPTVPLSPVDVPPGVFCTMPEFTPKVEAPPSARRMSVSALALL